MESLVQANLPQLIDLSFVQVLIVQNCFAQLAHGRWPLLAVLGLEVMDATSRGLLSDPLPAGLSWNLMHAINSIVVVARQPDDLLALTSGKWPCLQSLTFRNFPVHDDDVPILVQAAWPQLTSLTMIGCFRDSISVTLCIQRWPRLKSLTLGLYKHHLQMLKGFAQSGHPTLTFHGYNIMSGL